MRTGEASGAASLLTSFSRASTSGLASIAFGATKRLLAPLGLIDAFMLSLLLLYEDAPSEPDPVALQLTEENLLEEVHAGFPLKLLIACTFMGVGLNKASVSPSVQGQLCFTSP
mmetsp:Transcript_11265/g.23734  ORF Transcript_11265/g.23734 Transcript_11265/m.23734 type:complete len:114 (-) Transcript_11265:17-358(-)